VKMNGIDIDAVYLRLRPGNGLEHAEASLAYSVRQGGGCQDFSDIVEFPFVMAVSRSVMLRKYDIDLRSRDSPARLSRYRQFVSGNIEGAKRLDKKCRFDAQVNHGAQIHVSAYAGETIIIQNFHRFDISLIEQIFDTRF